MEFAEQLGAVKIDLNVLDMGSACYWLRPPTHAQWRSEVARSKTEGQAEGLVVTVDDMGLTKTAARGRRGSRFMIGAAKTCPDELVMGGVATRIGAKPGQRPVFGLRKGNGWPEKSGRELKGVRSCPGPEKGLIF